MESTPFWMKINCSFLFKSNSPTVSSGKLHVWAWAQAQWGMGRGVLLPGTSKCGPRTTLHAWVMTLGSWLLFHLFFIHLLADNRLFWGHASSKTKHIWLAVRKWDVWWNYGVCSKQGTALVLKMKPSTYLHGDIPSALHKAFTDTHTHRVHCGFPTASNLFRDAQAIICWCHALLVHITLAGGAWL